MCVCVCVCVCVCMHVSMCVSVCVSYVVFNLTGIPTLVILNENGEVITRNGRGAISLDPNGKVMKSFVQSSIHVLVLGVVLVCMVANGS